MTDFTVTTKHVGGNVRPSELQRVIDKLEDLKTKAPNAIDAACIIAYPDRHFRTIEPRRRSATIAKAAEIMYLMTN